MPKNDVLTPEGEMMHKREMNKAQCLKELRAIPGWEKAKILADWRDPKIYLYRDRKHHLHFMTIRFTQHEGKLWPKEKQACYHALLSAAKALEAIK